MCMKAYRWAIQLRGLSGTEKSVLICICDHYNPKSGTAWPSINRIAKQTGWNPRTVSRAIKSLKEGGYIAVQRAHFVNLDDIAPNRYYLPMLEPHRVPKNLNKPYQAKGAFDKKGNFDHHLDE